MNTLLISTCNDELSEREFVLPISRIVGQNNHKILHYKQCTEKIISSYDKIIICGTSLKDNSYIMKLDHFKKLFYNFPGSIMGICSGMHVVCSMFGCQIIKNLEIGMVEIEILEKNILCENTFQAYSLHNYSVNNLENFIFLARSKNSIQIVKHKDKNVFGVSFHPEVRNEKIILNFLKS
ncbi:MAG TPA: hypothetical protein QGI59_03330 [Candidatus Poseidoniia archaeon]|jgi:GMP synthase (glutamine-hydrolysing)|nr:hypothetical protein [Candidatus Poseidoniia archaeon]|tara:strand:- start:913 stop:1452 length:540 start_codon:yes stop_codon:yes gene_type:complete